MNCCAAPESHLLLHFQEFYVELHRLREQIAGATPRQREASVAMAGRKLERLLEAQSSDARATLDAAAFEVYREAQYVMAALADDLFSSNDDFAATAWKSLEVRFFRASSAAVTFFEKLEYLLEGHDTAHIELAQIYFFALCLGFQGRYRGTDGLTPLTQYRERLFAKIFNERPTLLHNDAPLVPLAPVRQIPPDEARSLPRPQIWMALPAGVLLLWVLFSFVFWTGFVRPISQMINSSSSSSAVDGQ